MSTSLKVSRANRGVVVWFTGLSGAGKTTLASALALGLRRSGRRVEVLDGDIVREHLCAGLGFSREDRDRNVARISFVAHLLARNGVIVLVAAISPYRATRDQARDLISQFVEVHVAAPVGACIERDTKGLYRRALDGEVTHFTGISDPYEPPLSPEVTIDTSLVDVETAVERVRTKLVELAYLQPDVAWEPPSRAESRP